MRNGRQHIPLIRHNDLSTSAHAASSPDRGDSCVTVWAMTNTSKTKKPKHDCGPGGLFDHSQGLRTMSTMIYTSTNTDKVVVVVVVV